MRKPDAVAEDSTIVRSSRRHGSAAAIAVGAALFLAGCSTPGPVHLYSVAPRATDIHDATVTTTDVARDVPSHLEPEDEITGFAYDPFTDHFFLRLRAGNHIRVVDRPARKIKREFEIDGIAADTSGDLAVSPRDGHLFLVDPRAPAVDETSRLGKFVRRVELHGRTQPAAAIAFDARENQLIVLSSDGITIERFGLAGEKLGSATLDRRVEPSLAYDPENHALFAPVSGTATAGVFDEHGRMNGTIPIDSADRFIDVGPHSFLRVF